VAQVGCRTPANPPQNMETMTAPAGFLHCLGHSSIGPEGVVLSWCKWLLARHVAAGSFLYCTYFSALPYGRLSVADRPETASKAPSDSAKIRITCIFKRCTIYLQCRPVFHLFSFLTLPSSNFILFSPWASRRR